MVAMVKFWLPFTPELPLKRRKNFSMFNGSVLDLVRQGNLDGLKRIRKSGLRLHANFTKSILMSEAAKFNHLHVLKWLCDVMKCNPTQDTLRAAVLCGNVENVEWILQKCPTMKCSEGTLVHPAESLDLDMMDILLPRRHLYFIGRMNQAPYMAIVDAKNLQAFKWYYENFPDFNPFNDAFVMYVITHDGLSILLWGFEHYNIWSIDPAEFQYRHYNKHLCYSCVFFLISIRKCTHVPSHDTIMETLDTLFLHEGCEPMGEPRMNKMSLVRKDSPEQIAQRPTKRQYYIESDSELSEWGIK